MKRKTRLLVFGKAQYVWWCRFAADGVSLVISPARDKTSSASVWFGCASGGKELPQAAAGCFPACITVQKGDMRSAVRTASQRMVHILLEYLSVKGFPHSTHTVYGGYALLGEMGYRIIKIQQQWDW